MIIANIHRMTTMVVIGDHRLNSTAHPHHSIYIMASHNQPNRQSGSPKAVHW